jgi:hypothetical protein
MQLQQKAFHEIFDVAALRILTPNLESCYRALAVVQAGTLKRVSFLLLVLTRLRLALVEQAKPLAACPKWEQYLLMVAAMEEQVALVL